MRIFLIASGAAMLASCGAVGEEKPLEETLQGASNFINTQGPGMLGDRLQGAKLATYVEGNVLVMRIENLPTGNYTYDPATVRKMMRPNVCDTPGNRFVIDRGGKFRIEMVSNTGLASPPVTIARC